MGGIIEARNKILEIMVGDGLKVGSDITITLAPGALWHDGSSSIPSHVPQGYTDHGVSAKTSIVQGIVEQIGTVYGQVFLRVPPGKPYWETNQDEPVFYVDAEYIKDYKIANATDAPASQNQP